MPEYNFFPGHYDYLEPDEERIDESFPLNPPQGEQHEYLADPDSTSSLLGTYIFRTITLRAWDNPEYLPGYLIPAKKLT